MKRYIITLFVFLLYINVAAQQPGKYSRAVIWFEGKSHLTLASLGFDLSEGYFREGVSFTGEFGYEEIKRASDAGFHVEILIEDLQKHFIEGRPEEKISGQGVCHSNSPVYQIPSNFSLGSMGGYFTYNEMLNAHF